MTDESKENLKITLKVVAGFLTAIFTIAFAEPVFIHYVQLWWKYWLE